MTLKEVQEMIDTPREVASPGAESPRRQRPRPELDAETSTPGATKPEGDSPTREDHAELAGYDFDLEELPSRD